MRRLAVRQPHPALFDQQSHPIVNGDLVSTVVKLIVGGLIAWFIGIMFLIGWSLATVGTLSIGRNVIEGGAAIFIAAICAAAGRLSHIRIPGIGSWTALGVGIILVEVAFPVGALLGCIFNAIWGAYPDMSWVRY